MYIIENHMGGFYVTDYCPDYDELYCEECGDSDFILGEAENRKEAWDILKDRTQHVLRGEEACEYCGCKGEGICNGCDRIYDTGGDSYGYVAHFIAGNFPEPEGQESAVYVLAARDEKSGRFYQFNGTEEPFIQVLMLDDTCLDSCRNACSFWPELPIGIGRHKIGDTEYIIEYLDAEPIKRPYFAEDEHPAIMREEDTEKFKSNALFQAVLEDVEKHLAAQK